MQRSGQRKKINMDITTKYGINDVVYDIVNSPIRTWVECPACEGAGQAAQKERDAEIAEDLLRCVGSASSAAAQIASMIRSQP